MQWTELESLYRVKLLPVQATKALRAGRSIALPNLSPRHWRWGWGGQYHAPAALTRERPGTHCTRDCVGPRDRLDGCGKSLPPTGIRSPDRPARSESLYRLSYPGRKVCITLLKINSNLSYLITPNLWKFYNNLEQIRLLITEFLLPRRKDFSRVKCVKNY